MEEEITTTIKQVNKNRPINVREIAREVALSGLSLKIKLPGATAFFKKPRVQFLYVHHVFKDEIEKFDHLLNELSKHHTFISYSEAVTRILTNTIDKPYICISSDDGFKNNLNAAKILDKYGIKGCFFINPDTIGMTDFSQVKQFCNERLEFPPTEFMDWDDISDLQKRGHEIGSHTVGHINIAETNINEVEDNINLSFKRISEMCGSGPHFAFPYGRYFHFHQQAFELVFKAGHISCASAERGCHISPLKVLNPDELFIRRDHVIVDWNLNHIMYFILNNSKKAIPQTNLSPYQIG